MAFECRIPEKKFASECHWSKNEKKPEKYLRLDNSQHKSVFRTHTCNSSHGIAPHSSHEIAATCTFIADVGPRFCRISSTVANRNVTIETKSRRRHVLVSDGSDGEDIFVL